MPDELKCRDPQEEAFTQYLARAARVDVDQFGSLYERVAPAVFAWANLRIAKDLRASLGPEDLMQEVWCRAFRVFKQTYDPGRTTFRAWVFTIAKNVLLEGIRAAARWPVQPERARTASVFDLDEHPHQVTSLTSRICRQESIARFLGHVGRLSLL